MLDFMKLGDFVEKYSEDHELAQQMLAKLLKTPPPQSMLPESEHISATYNDRADEEKIAVFAHNILQKSTIQLDQGSRIQKPRQIAEIFGCYSADTAIVMKQFMFKHAILFDITPVGACTDRAAYAALTLAEIFKEHAINVAYTSNIKKNQFAVILGNKDIGYYVYDPLTNPELIFSHEYYTKHVLSTFPDNQRTNNKVKITITGEILEAFQAQKDQIRTSLTNHIKNNLPSSDEVYDDIVFHMAMQNLGYYLQDEHGALDNAIEYLKKTLGIAHNESNSYNEQLVSNQSFTPQHDLSQSSASVIEESTPQSSSMSPGRRPQ